MPASEIWLDPPPRGTSVCAGFDGSENDDHTAIKLETREGLIFTPRYGPDRRPTIWDPANWPHHRIPREQVHVAWEEISRTYNILRAYCDPGFHDEMDYSTEIEEWDLKYGPDVFIPWPTNIVNRMYPALRRFEADLATGSITHDGCPITTTQIGNAIKLPKSADRYVLGKPAQHQKIDVGMTTVLCHEAAADMRAEGWNTPNKGPNISTRMYGFN
jgi:phage terminase large subunit-like protein